MIINQIRLISILNELLTVSDLKIIKNEIAKTKLSLSNFKTDSLGLLNISSNGDTLNIKSDYLHGEIDQILETKTIERTKYYIERLIKSLSEIKTNKINDLNLNRWKEYDDIITDSLWFLDKRDNSGAHNAGYWGNFIPQIPNQLMQRYTKAGDWVLDPFLGSGTTLIECKRLGRNGIGIELKPEVSKLAEKNIKSEQNLFSKEIKTEIITADSTDIDYPALLKTLNIKNVQLILLHPPYWDIIKFSDDPRDLSNNKSISEFLTNFGKIIDKTYPILEKDRYLAVIISDKYSQGEWIPLGFLTMQEVMKRHFKLKATIIKNFDETKAKMNQKELWRYRALVGGFYIFKHEYIFLFKK